MGIVRRGNYIFRTLVADHGNHVHICKDGKQVLKWDLERMQPVKGIPTGRLLKIINELIEQNVFRHKI